MRNAPKLWPAEPSKRARTRPAGGARADSLRDRAAEPGADGAVGVRDRVRGLDEPRAADRGLALREEERAEPVALVRHRLADVARRAPALPHEQRREVERVRGGVARAPLAQALDAADRLVERAEAERGEQLAHLERDEAEVRLDHLGRPAELRPQLRPLARDPDGARVEVAGAHHQAALGEEERRAERELVGAEQRGDDDVAPGLEAAVDAQAHAPAEAVARRAPAASRRARAPTARPRA